MNKNSIVCKYLISAWYRKKQPIKVNLFVQCPLIIGRSWPWQSKADTDCEPHRSEIEIYYQIRTCSLHVFMVILVSDL